MKKIYISLALILLAVSYFGLKKSRYSAAVDELKERVTETEAASPETYDKLVMSDQLHHSFLVDEAVHCVMYENSFPYTSHVFESDDTQNIIRMLNDSSNYRWGEIGTPHYDRCILFYDKADELAGCINISMDGEIIMFPYRAVSKWGLLSDKGFKELAMVTRTR
jgi:hypothetical protein